MQDHTVLGCCASNFDCCLRIGPPTRLLKKTLQVLSTVCSSCQGKYIVGFSVCSSLLFPFFQNARSCVQPAKARRAMLIPDMGYTPGLG